MKKIIITYGLVAGLISMCFMLTSVLVLDVNTSPIVGMVIGFTGMFLAFIFVFVGIKNYRDKHNAGKITFLEAFKIGFFIALIASCIYTIAWLIEFHFFMPDFMEKFSAKAIEDYKASTMSAVEMQQKITEMENMKENYKNPLYRIGYTLIEILPLGTVIALIAALIMKRNTPKIA